MIGDLEDISLYGYHYSYVMKINNDLCDLISSINLLIKEFYFINIFEFDKIKKSIYNTLVLLKCTMILIDINNKFINNINEIIFLFESIHYPVYLHTISKIKFYHKKNSIGVKKYFNEHFDELEELDKSDSEELDKSDSEELDKSDSEDNWTKSQRYSIKNNIKNTDFEYIKQDMNNNENKTNRKQYNIVSKEIRINWKKSYITI